MDRVIVIGGGAAGLMAAGTAARENREAEVLLVERNGLLGKKLLLTGKGRCNITNGGDVRSFVTRFGPGGRFLYSAFSRFFQTIYRAAKTAVENENGISKFAPFQPQSFTS